MMDEHDYKSSFLSHPLKLAHHLIAMVLKPGDTAVDATAGNGNDTCFLCQVVGPDGVVFAFDKQPQAIGKTAEKIKDSLIKTKVYFINDGHEKMDEYINQSVQAVMFNLGYLPGTGHLYSTRSESTVAALEEAKNLLSERGIITVVVYSGHKGALEEKAAVEHWASSLPQVEWTVMSCSFPNWRNHPPQLIAITKRNGIKRRGDSYAAGDNG